MNETLKGVAHIGAELAAAKADLQREMERHRKTFTQLEQVQRENAALKKLLDRANERMDELKSGGLSQQAEPLEPAPAQTEQQPCAKIEVLRDPEGRLSAKVRAFEASLLPVGQMVAVYTAHITQTAPQPEQSADFHFRNGALEFAGYLLDNCEGATVAEESLQLWLSEALRNKATPSPATVPKP